MPYSSRISKITRAQCPVWGLWDRGLLGFDTCAAIVPLKAEGEPLQRLPLEAVDGWDLVVPGTVVVVVHVATSFRWCASRSGGPCERVKNGIPSLGTWWPSSDRGAS